MLDDLRNSAAKSFQEEEGETPALTPEPRQPHTLRPRPREPFLGMTPQQRFVVSLMMFLMVSVLGALLLVVTEKVFIAF
jgi:hypothetical protein